MNLYNKLLKYSKSDIYPMHMPGHKRNDKILRMTNPYLIDITEIEGFDNLFHADDILQQGMERAALLYNSDYSNYLVGGSSAGILSGISACTNKGDKVLIARNCHKSVYNAIYLKELNPIYICPHIEDEFGIDCGILPEKIEDLLIEHKDIKLIVITSPTYEGVISDVRGITSIAHKYGIPVFVDEAHGAHLGFHSYFPNNSIESGADITVHSLHKTLPSFTQTGLLHVNSDLVDYAKIQKYLSIYQSTSPSYVLMASIDKCINLLMEKRRELFDNFAKQLKNFYKQLEGLKNLKVVMKNNSSFNKNNGFFDFDQSKVVVSVRNTNITGKQLYDLLLKTYKIQIEMASSDYIIAMTSISDTKSGFSRLAHALLEIDGKINKKIHDTEGIIIDNLSLELNEIYQKIETIMTSHDAIESESESIPFKQSAGRITREYVYLYPPGIPILVPGERITNKHIEEIEKYKKLGLSIQGLDDYSMKFIKVVS